MRPRALKTLTLMGLLAISGLVLPGQALAKPDLTVTKIEVAPPQPAAGKAFQVKATVYNSSTDRAGRASTLI